MKWFNKWFQNKCKEAWEQAQVDEKRSKESVYEVKLGNALYSAQFGTGNGLINNSSSASLFGKAWNFKIFQANGGYIVEIQQNDPLSNNINLPHLHIVHSDADLGQELSKILTYQLLKQ